MINSWKIGYLHLLLPLADAHGILIRGQQACHGFSAEILQETIEILLHKLILEVLSSPVARWAW